MKILMLEDDAPLIQTMTAALEMRGHEVVVARSISDGLLQMGGTAVPFEGFDVLLLDHELPDGVGLTLLRTLRDVPRERRPKTIYWSGLDRSTDLAAAGLSADVLLTKDLASGCLDAIETP